MRSLIIVGIVAILAIGSATNIQAQSFQLDSSHAQVGFRVQHFGVSYLRGWFGDVTGTLEFSENPSKMSVEVLIKSGSLITSFPTRTEHALSDNFLGAEEFPEITFKSTKIEKKNDTLVVTGDLTIRGTTKQVTFPFTTLGPRPGPFGNTRFGATGTLEIDRLEFGVPFNRNMEDGVPMVGVMVEIDLSVEFTHKKD